MRIISPSFEMLSKIDGMEVLKYIEMIGRTCYKSEDKITESSCITFVKNIIKRGHESVLEHYSFGVRFIVSRNTSHQIVRHRLSSISQESQRYCCYKEGKFNSEVTFIEPLFANDADMRNIWVKSCKEAEDSYFALLNRGLHSEDARLVLPNSAKTELVMTANLREWRHILTLRTSSAADKYIRQVMNPLLDRVKDLIPYVFDDIPSGAPYSHV